MMIVVPCYNEEEALAVTAEALRTKLENLKQDRLIQETSGVIFVDDGSRDDTWSIIERLHGQFPDLYHGVKLAHNRGHQNALYAGLMQALAYDADACISMDADLQDDPDAVDEMIREYQNGAEIVFGVRDNRDTDTAFKRGTAHAFYALMGWLGTETVPDHADYRLMSREALKALSQYREVNLFLRGIVPSLGFQTAKVYYKRGTRVAGESVRVGGRDFILHEAAGDDYGNGCSLRSDRHCDVHLYSGVGVFRSRGCRMGVDNVFDVVPGRFRPSCHRHRRRVHREDLPRGQTASALHRGKVDLNGAA